MMEESMSNPLRNDVVVHPLTSSSPEKKSNASRAPRKPAGWKSMPYILGNETFERLASYGLLANFMVYLVTVYHLDQVTATTLMGVWNGITNFLPLLGAFISDAFLGRYKTIAIASIFALFGMVTMTLTAWIPGLHPAACGQGQKCEGPTPGQFGFLIMSLCLVSIGTGGIRPCSIPFGVDQFDPKTEEGKKGMASFYNWYYASFTVVLMLTFTVVVYIQDKVSWVLGYGIPTILMFIAVVLFFVGSYIYVMVKPEGSIFTALAQVAAAAYKKRHLKLPAAADRSVFYDPPLSSTTVVLSKLPLTDQFRCLNRAAIVLPNEVNPDGTPVNKWNLCTIQQVEEFKCLIRVTPIWLTGILSMTPVLAPSTFSISQALKMDRHMGPKFEAPASSINVISFLTIAIWIAIYDQLVVPTLRRVTGHRNGITELQRMGIGILFGILSMVAAGITEMQRRNWAKKSVTISVFWLAPQNVFIGLFEAFNLVGQIEFFNKEFPEHMRTMGNALAACSLSLASYLTTALVQIVHKATAGADGSSDWLASDLNAGKLDLFYYTVAGVSFVNLFLFVFCAKNYRYKGKGNASETGDGEVLELVSGKNVDV